MITVQTGDLLQSNAQTLVNTVNCVGIMGKGIALGFKKRFPDMFRDYATRCAAGSVKLGQPYVYRQLLDPWVLNFPTKDHWRSLAKLDEIEQGLEYLESHYTEWGITSLAVPPLGCGNGQLEWRVVGPTLYRFLSRFDIPVELYAPEGTPFEELQSTFLDRPDSAFSRPTSDHDMGRLWIKPAWIALVEIVKRIDEQPYHWPIGRTIFQKIAYVATALGLPTGLEFEQGGYGPFSPEIKKLESRLIGNGLLNEQRVGSQYRVSIGRTYGDATSSFKNDLIQWQTIIDRTVDLFMRIRSSDQAELVATVIYAANRISLSEGTPGAEDVFEAVSHWKRRRNPPLDPSDIHDTIRGLASQGWIALKSEGDSPHHLYVQQDLMRA